MNELSKLRTEVKIALVVGGVLLGLVAGWLLVVAPKLHDASMHRIDTFDTSFWAAVNRTDKNEATLGLLERHRVRVWLRGVYESFDLLFPVA